MTVHLAPYSPDWPVQFAEIRALLLPLFDVQAIGLEHIGSTSVPGLCAKPVIDVLLGAPDLACIEGRIDALAALGFCHVARHEATIPERRYFVRPAARWPRIHLHGVRQGSLLWCQQLAFRDALRSDAATREAYAALKQALAQTHRDDKAAYTEAKAPFIAQVLAAGGWGSAAMLSPGA